MHPPNDVLSWRLQTTMPALYSKPGLALVSDAVVRSPPHQVKRSLLTPPNSLCLLPLIAQRLAMIRWVRLVA